MENNFVAKDIREVAEKANIRIKKELPILKGILDAMVSSEMNIQLLPQAVHTIAVVAPDEGHIFLEGTNAVYKELMARDKPDCIQHDLWKSLKKTAEVAHKLHTQEKTEYKRQLNSFRSYYTKLAEDDPTINVEEKIAFEEPYFRHVECDISSALKSFIFIMIMGYVPSEKQINTLRGMMDIAKTKFESLIEKKENSLNTTEKILSVNKLN